MTRDGARVVYIDGRRKIWITNSDGSLPSTPVTFDTDRFGTLLNDYQLPQAGIHESKAGRLVFMLEGSDDTQRLGVVDADGTNFRVLREGTGTLVVADERAIVVEGTTIDSIDLASGMVRSIRPSLAVGDAQDNFVVVRDEEGNATHVAVRTEGGPLGQELWSIDLNTGTPLLLAQGPDLFTLRRFSRDTLKAAPGGVVVSSLLAGRRSRSDSALSCAAIRSQACLGPGGASGARCQLQRLERLVGLPSSTLISQRLFNQVEAFSVFGPSCSNLHAAEGQQARYVESLPGIHGVRRQALVSFAPSVKVFECFRKSLSGSEHSRPLRYPGRTSTAVALSVITNNIGGSWYPTYPQILAHADTPIVVTDSTIE